MKCPVCTTENLVMSEKQGVEIDYCPSCRGVWLDRGELDKIIERSAQYFNAEAAASAPAPAAGYGAPAHTQTDANSKGFGGDATNFAKQAFDAYKGSKGHHNGTYHKPHKKKSSGFLGDIFDF